jgi:hypothetical protein
MGGFAEARISDGTSGKIMRLPNGTWQAYLRGIEVDGPQGDHFEAASVLAHKLRAEGIWLRLGS